MKTQEITLENHEIKVKVLTLGGIVTHFSHKKDNINTVLSFKDKNNYIQNRGFLGAMVGPLAGRTENATFQMNGKKYQLDPNVPPHHLHGGKLGLSRQIFNILFQSNSSLILENMTDYTQTGYPAKLHTIIKYSLILNSLLIEVEAIPTSEMPINITNHSYFNLDQSDTIKDHKLQAITDKVVFVNSIGSNSNDIRMVKGTPFDLNESTHLEILLEKTHPQFEITKHLDHTYISNSNSKVILTNKTGIKELTVAFDTKSFQIYLANYFDGTLISESGKFIQKHAAIAIEPQNIPNEINIWGKQLYTPDKPFKSSIKYTLNYNETATK